MRDAYIVRMQIRKTLNAGMDKADSLSRSDWEAIHRIRSDYVKDGSFEGLRVTRSYTVVRRQTLKDWKARYELT